MKTLQLKTLGLIIFATASFNLSAQEGTVNIEQPKAIDQLLEYKKDIKTVETYKIQIYSGDSASGAENAKSKFMSSFGEWPIEMVFNTPNYKIWVGNFRNRLEADRALLRIKKNYMNAFIFKPKKD
ncbi:SPOR domain-containing protein [Winogradskyella litorisediminis]|uniref:SPOR domain-containing protein n=1 Tax=Winogradskyella litorisediminis TaxID=1156618 RepID=A0ABW3N439_9FLAO